MADTYNCSTANHILENCISKSKVNGFGVAKVKNGEIGEIAIPQRRPMKKAKSNNQMSVKSNPNIKRKKEYTTSVTNKYGELSAFSLKWLENISGVKDLRTNAEERGFYLSKMLDRIESLKCDVLHYIEFNKLNCSDGYKAYSVLRRLLQRRREVKDELDIAGYVIEQYTYDMERSVNQLIFRVEGKKERKYGVRAFEELFYGSINDTAVGEQLDTLLSDCLQ